MVGKLKKDVELESRGTGTSFPARSQANLFSETLTRVSSWMMERSVAGASCTEVEAAAQLSLSKWLE